RGEGHLARLALGQSPLHVLRQRGDRLGRQESPEELRLCKEIVLRRQGQNSLITQISAGPELVEVALRFTVGQLPERCRCRLRARSGGYFLEEFGGVCFAAQHPTYEVGHGRPLAVACGGEPQGGVELPGATGCPGLPGFDQRGGVCERPGEMKGGRRRRRQGPEDEGGEDAEVSPAGAAARPGEPLAAGLAA